MAAGLYVKEPSEFSVRVPWLGAVIGRGAATVSELPSASLSLDRTPLAGTVSVPSSSTL